MQLTTWFIAKEDEAEAIESIVTTEEHSPEDWSHLELPLGQLELMALSAALRGAEDITEESTLEKPLVFREEDGLLIARVVDTFLQALARVTDEGVTGLSVAWVERMDEESHEPEELRAILSELVSFARQAVARRSPVLSLSTF
ncbi:hypothetical protein [Archangium sp.]|uniref:hypothetical protein n=1 Tax=Archangium sp. TaxID=1872627 RepID=UPI00286BD3D6|nr:hypothetical protein [Archangium sp.]